MIEYRDQPAALLFDDGGAEGERLATAAAGAGLRLLGRERIEAQDVRLPRQARVDALLIGASSASRGLDRLLGEAEAAAVAGSRRCLMLTPSGLIDHVAAQAFHPDVVHLCDPTDGELAACLAWAARTPVPHLREANRGGGTDLLQRLSAEAARFASILASLSEGGGEEAPTAPVQGARGSPEIEGDPLETIAFIRTIIRARRLRDNYFTGEMFADPAWDMLLDLTAARLEGSRVAVSSLCIAAAVPATTALRWIKAMTAQGLFVRRADPQDGRRVHIELSDAAFAAMQRYLAEVRRSGGLTI